MCKYKLLDGSKQNFITKKVNISYFLNNIKEPAGHHCPAGSMAYVVDYLCGKSKITSKGNLCVVL